MIIRGLVYILYLSYFFFCVDTMVGRRVTFSLLSHFSSFIVSRGKRKGNGNV
jgi:hypothetical protein